LAVRNAFNYFQPFAFIPMPLFRIELMAGYTLGAKLNYIVGHCLAPIIHFWRIFLGFVRGFMEFFHLSGPFQAPVTKVTLSTQPHSFSDW
jgi:hypothetical protein